MIERITIRLAAEGQNLEIGTLVADRAQIYFRCAEEYLASGINISPFKLPKRAEVQQVNTTIFSGLFGVFADSLPDGWGRLVLDRALAESGVDIGMVTPLDRLAYVGTRGMGALTYHPEQAGAPELPNRLDLDRIATASAKILAGQSSEILEDLVELGGSSGGARPKILVGYNPATDEIMPDAPALPVGFEHWLIKFPATTDPVDVANIEFAYYQMALLADLEMMPCRLFTGKSGRQYFGTKRFDRQGGERLHLHSAAGLMHDNFRLSNMDYGHVMDAALRLEGSWRGPAKVLRLAAFNVLAHNRDDHSKNVAFLMDGRGNWRLAPAYDLTFSQSSHGYQSMMVAGQSKSPDERALLELAHDFSLKKPNLILAEVQAALGNWPQLAKETGVSQRMIREVSRVIGL